MQVNIENKSTVKKIIHIEIPNEDIKKELNEAYKELKKTAVIKGFRKGKAPRKVLENKFRKDVHSDIAPRLIQESFSEVLKDNDLQIVGGPKVDPPELDPETSFAFDIIVEVKPEIEDIDFKGINIKKTMHKISENEVEAQLQMIRKTLAKKEPVKEERPVKENDFVLIDYQGFIDGKPFDKTPKIENYVMAMGSDTMPTEFTEKLTGVIPEQELEIDVVYTADSPNTELAGKAITYKILLKEIQEEILPPVNDKLATELGDYKDIDDLKGNIRKNLHEGYDRRIQQEMDEQVFKFFAEKYKFEVPDALVEAELNGIVAEAEQAYARHNISLEDAGLSSGVLKQQYRDVAEKQAKRHLILDKIIEQEKIELTEDELEKSFKETAVSMGATADAIKNMFKMNEQQFEFYKHAQLEKKVLKTIMENGNITEVEPEAANKTTAETTDGNVADNDDNSVKDIKEEETLKDNDESGDGIEE